MFDLEPQFLDNMLDAAKAHDSTVTLMILAQSIEQDGHRVTISEDALITALVKKVQLWLPTAGQNDYVFLSDMFAILANLSVSAQASRGNSISSMRTLFSGWKQQLIDKKNKRAQRVASNLEILDTKILAANQIDWSVIAN